MIVPVLFFFFSRESERIVKYIAVNYTLLLLISAFIRISYSRCFIKLLRYRTRVINLFIDLCF